MRHCKILREGGPDIPEGSKRTYVVPEISRETVGKAWI